MSAIKEGTEAEERLKREFAAQIERIDLLDKDKERENDEFAKNYLGR